MIMIDLVKKTLLTGVGVAALTKEKIEEVARDFVEKGKLSEQEGKALVEDLVTRSDESRAELQRQIEAKVNVVLEKMDLARKSDLDALKAEIQELRQSMEENSSVE